jgi:hypothetical protein
MIGNKMGMKSPVTNNESSTIDSLFKKLLLVCFRLSIFLSVLTFLRDVFAEKICVLVGQLTFSRHALSRQWRYAASISGHNGARHGDPDSRTKKLSGGQHHA